MLPDRRATLRTRAILLITLTVLGGTATVALSSLNLVRDSYTELAGPAVASRVHDVLGGLESRIARLRPRLDTLATSYNAAAFVQREPGSEDFPQRIDATKAEQWEVEAILVVDRQGEVLNTTLLPGVDPALVAVLAREAMLQGSWSGIVVDPAGAGLMVAVPIVGPTGRAESGQLIVFDRFDERFALPGVVDGLDGVTIETFEDERLRRGHISTPFTPTFVDQGEVAELRLDVVGTTAVRITAEPPARLVRLEARTVRDLSWRVVVFGVFIGLVLLVWFERRLLSRLATLSGLVTAATDDPTDRPTVELDGDDELVDLAERIERTLAALEDARDEVADRNEGLLAADAAKDRFLSVVSHELRTPLTAILGFTETLLVHAEALDEAARREFLERVASQARALDGMVEDLLVLSRVQSGRVDHEPQVLALEDQLAEILAGLPVDGPVATEGVEDVLVLIDPDHLRRIVANYVQNAFKYGEPPVRIVTTRTESSWITLRVIDEGDGVPEGFAPKLFDRFTQASSGDTRTSSGVGLGLSIVRELAEHHGGRAFYERFEGRTCFAVTLPLASTSAPMRTATSPA